MNIGINLEVARSLPGISLESSLRRVRKIGYNYVEPYVYSGMNLPINSHLTLNNSTPWCQIDTDTTDPRLIREIMGKIELKFSAIDAHTSLLLPHVGISYLIKAIDFASEVDCPVVVSDEGPISEWISLKSAFDIMCISLESVVKRAQSRGIIMAIEPHNALTTKPQWVSKLMKRFTPEELSINFDTGNTFLAGNDPVQMLGSFVKRVVHVHAKDIPQSQVSERGRVTSTRVGVAIGDGVIDFPSIVKELKSNRFQGVLCVECDTFDQADKSFAYLKKIS